MAYKKRNNLTSKNNPVTKSVKDSIVAYSLLFILILIPSLMIINYSYNRICKSIEYMSVGIDPE